MSQIREQVKKEDTQIKSQSVHHSQSDSAKGYGGTYGVQKERQDKVCVLMYLSSLVSSLQLHACSPVCVMRPI